MGNALKDFLLANSKRIIRERIQRELVEKAIQKMEIKDEKGIKFLTVALKGFSIPKLKKFLKE